MRGGVLLCSAFSVRRKIAWSRELGAWSACSALGVRREIVIGFSC